MGRVNPSLRVVARSPGDSPGERRRQFRRVRRDARHDRAVRAGHRRLRQPAWRYLLGGDVATVLSAPIIYSTFVPFVLLDGWISLYQAICFRLWGVRRVRRRDYFVLDRHKLAYLNTIEKVHCLFCSYANGLIAYVREVAARTEQYWCPIRHARRTCQPHDRYGEFVAYGDADSYRDQLPALRAALRK